MQQVVGGGEQPSGTNSTELLSANDFIFRSKLDNVNLFKLRRHIRESNLVGKMVATVSTSPRGGRHGHCH